MDNQLNEKQSLEIIHNMIHQAKKKFSNQSFYYLLWGWLVFTASLSQYFLMRFTDYENHFIAWPFLMGFGLIATIIYTIKFQKKKPVKNYLDEAMGYFWGAFLISLFIILFFMTRVNPNIIYPVIIIMYGWATFASGGFLKFKPLIFGGISCWIMAIIGFLSEDFPTQLLLIAGAILASYIIPGHLLARREK